MREYVRVIFITQSTISENEFRRLQPKQMKQLIVLRFLAILGVWRGDDGRVIRYDLY